MRYSGTGFGRGRDQRGHFRPGGLGVLRPAGGLADIDEGDVARAFDLGGDLGEQRRFLRAGDGERLAAGAAARKRSSSARHRWRPGRSPRRRGRHARTASPSSGMVSSQEQIRILRGRSAIVALTFVLGPPIRSANRRIRAAYEHPGRGTGLGTIRSYNYSDSKRKVERGQCR